MFLHPRSVLLATLGAAAMVGTMFCCQVPRTTPGGTLPVQTPPLAMHRDAGQWADADTPSVDADARGLVMPARAPLEAFGTEQNLRDYAAQLADAALTRQRNQEAELEARRQRAAHPDSDKPTATHGIPQLGAQSMDGGVMGASNHRDRERSSSVEPAAAAPAARSASETSNAATSSITNNQEQGVDEGDIVKVRGNDLIILRRGRLFSVRMEGSRLQARSVISAAPPNVSPASWYDEMLVDGDTILVTGYGYERRATEINRFNIDANAVITYRDTILLRSGDYYSSRNYASRIVNHKLVLYSPVPLFEYSYDPQTRSSRQTVAIPGWKTLNGEWQSSADWLEVYRPMRRVGHYPILHTVQTCDLATTPMRCHARAVLAGHSRSFYVSSSAIYLWMSAEPTDADSFAPTNEAMWSHADPANCGAVVYRFPLGDAPVGAVVAGGAPIDQFSFRETAEKLQVNVLGHGGGDAMWGPEDTSGAMGLYQIPVSHFTRQVPYAETTMLRRLPGVEQQYMMQNRFVGDYLLYGSGDTWWRGRRRHGRGRSIDGDEADPQRQIMVHNIARNVNQTIPVEHSVDRIEPMALDAVVVGTDSHNNLHFSALSLATSAERRGHFVRENAAQGETRSHGFFYLPEGDRRGMLGLPLRRGGDSGWRQLREGSAEVLFLRTTDLNFHQLGSLVANASLVSANDQCVASCMDWYGNARPIFYRGHVYALMGYELVEGLVTANSLTERTRLNYLEAVRSRLTSR